MAHSFFSSLRLVHGRACGGLFHSRATDTDETSVLACSRGRENGWWLREHFSLTNSPSRRRVQSVFGQLKSVYTVTVHLTLGGQSSDTSLPNLPGPFWSSAIVSPSARHLPSRHRRHRRQNAKEGLQSHFFCNEARGPSQSPRQAVFRGKTVVDRTEKK